MQVAVTFPSEPTIRHKMVLDKQLGMGKFKVFLAKAPALNTQYALKVFSRDFHLRGHYSRENESISRLDHPNIIKHYPVLSHNFRLDIMLTEYTPNGDLFGFVTKGCLQNEKLVRSYFHQLIEGLEHIHEQGITHLDLKLENILLDADYVLKIIDFDQAQLLTDQRLCSFGTNGYRAPEVIDKSGTDFKAVDIYSAGIILFACKACEFPFVEPEDTNDPDVKYYDTFTNANQEFWAQRSEKIGQADFFSEDFKELVNGMLEKDATKRYTINDIKASKWYKGSTYTGEELKQEIEQVMRGLEDQTQQ